MLLKSVTAAAIGGASIVIAANPDKPEMDPPFDRVRFENGLRANLPSQDYEWEFWAEGWIPEGCKTIAQSVNMNPEDFSVFNVRYGDCELEWTLCRHKDCGYSAEHLMEMLGRTPVGMRQFLRHALAIPGGAGWIYATGDVVFAGKPNLDIFLHESSHSLDLHALTGGRSRFCDTSTWQDAYAKDSHTTTGYGRNNWLEDFAESSMVGVFNKVVPGGFGTIAGNWGQIANQYHTAQNYFDAFINPGGRCTRRFRNSLAVSKYNAKVTAASRPDTSFDASDASDVTIMESIEGLEPICEYPH